MKNNQVFASIDSLKNYKQLLINKYNCMFFEHNTNAITTINCGMKDFDIYHEKIITDGDIKVIGKNIGKPSIVCEEEYITFDKGMSLVIEISNSTFYINLLCRNKETLYEIHMNEESLELIDKIMNYIYKCRNGIDTSAMALYYPDTIKLTDFEQDMKTENIYFYSEKKKCLKLKKR
jgi:hypothetical protein